MLLTRPIPDLGETLQSYIIQLARLNHYKFEHWSLYLSNESVAYRSRDIADRNQLREFVFQSTGMPNVNLLFDQWQFFDTEKKYFDYKKIKVCPICFGSNRHKLMAQWSFRYNLVCPEHNCSLVEQCSSCGESVTERIIYGMKCDKCELPLHEFEVKETEVDYFSKRIEQLVGEAILQKREALIDELAWQYNHIEALSLLVYQDGNQLWRRKRSYSIKQKHEHQTRIGQLLNDNTLLQSALNEYMQSQFAQGKTDLGIALTKLNKYLVNNTCPVLIIAVKKLINSFQFSDSQTVGLVWLEKLFDFPQKSLTDYVKTKYPSLILKTQGPASVSLNNVNHILEYYQKTARL
jgi:hypothetical protein